MDGRASEIQGTSHIHALSLVSPFLLLFLFPCSPHSQPGSLHFQMAELRMDGWTDGWTGLDRMGLDGFDENTHTHFLSSPVSVASSLLNDLQIMTEFCFFIDIYICIYKVGLARSVGKRLVSFIFHVDGFPQIHILLISTHSMNAIPLLYPTHGQHVILGAFPKLSCMCVGHTRCAHLCVVTASLRNVRLISRIISSSGTSNRL